MPSPGPITRLPTVLPVFEPLASNFQQLVAEGLGNVGTSADGFDALLNDVALALEADRAIGFLDDSDLVSAFFTLGEFEASNITPVISDVATFQAGGDALFGNVTPPAPGGGGPGGGPGGGGGGPGGGGGSGPPQLCGYPPNATLTAPDITDMIQQITDQQGVIADRLEQQRC